MFNTTFTNCSNVYQLFLTITQVPTRWNTLKVFKWNLQINFIMCLTWKRKKKIFPYINWDVQNEFLLWIDTRKPLINSIFAKLIFWLGFDLGLGFSTQLLTSLQLSNFGCFWMELQACKLPWRKQVNLKLIRCVKLKLTFLYLDLKYKLIWMTRQKLPRDFFY